MLTGLDDYNLLWKRTDDIQFSKGLDRFGDEIFAALNNRRMELEVQGMVIII